MQVELTPGIRENGTAAFVSTDAKHPTIYTDAMEAQLRAVMEIEEACFQVARQLCAYRALDEQRVPNFQLVIKYDFWSYDLDAPNSISDGFNEPSKRANAQRCSTSNCGEGNDGDEHLPPRRTCGHVLNELRWIVLRAAWCLPVEAEVSSGSCRGRRSDLERASLACTTADPDRAATETEVTYFCDAASRRVTICWLVRRNNDVQQIILPVLV
jgi:hypothetical protein